MILLVSGEGARDIGACCNGQGECSGTDFRPGPMAVIIDKLVEPIANDSWIGLGAMDFISRSKLSSLSRELPMALPGKKREPETIPLFKNARALAKLAQKSACYNKTPTGAVLFHDTDGTHSTKQGLFEKKWQAMEDGFNAAQFDYGVPMVPKPKSEAWLLCALKSNPYQSCARLEELLPGNDSAIHPAKAQLGLALTASRKQVSDLADMVTDGTINPNRIDMPSFNRFKERLEWVTRAMLGLPQPATGA